jgi:hypothetical protein
MQLPGARAGAAARRAHAEQRGRRGDGQELASAGAMAEESRKKRLALYHIGNSNPTLGWASILID